MKTQLIDFEINLGQLYMQLNKRHLKKKYGKLYDAIIFILFISSVSCLWAVFFYTPPKIEEIFVDSPIGFFNYLPIISVKAIFFLSSVALLNESVRMKKGVIGIDRDFKDMPFEKDIIYFLKGNLSKNDLDEIYNLHLSKGINLSYKSVTEFIFDINEKNSLQDSLKQLK